MLERLQKALASGGIGSRRACEAWITQGRVRVDGQVVTELGVKVDLDTQRVTFDGRPVRLPRKRYYIALNKPRNVVCSLSDAHAARLVTELVDLQSDESGRKPLLRPVGRLDADTEGLIFLTDDGDFLFKLTHPSHHVPKTYRAEVRGIPDAAALERLAKGVLLEDGMTAPAQNVRVARSKKETYPRHKNGDPSLLGKGKDRVEASSSSPFPNREGSARNEPGIGPSEAAYSGPLAEVELTIFEGRNRQVRRMLAEIGHPVTRLTRTRIGGVTLGGLAPGAWRHLTPKEIAVLTKIEIAKKENTQSWPTEPRPSRPPKAPSSPSSPKTTRPRRPATSSPSPKKGSTTG